MRACACGERTKQAYVWCGRTTSSVYCPAPVRKRASSLRSMRDPMGPAGFVARHPNADEAKIREELEGNLCRCTGYQNIVRAVAQGAAAMAK
jgi:hypothetical protein